MASPRGPTGIETAAGGANGAAAAAAPADARSRATAKAALARTAAYFMGEYAVGLRIWGVRRLRSGPFFSVSANFARRSASLMKALHFFSRSARLSYASM